MSDLVKWALIAVIIISTTVILVSSGLFGTLSSGFSSLGVVNNALTSVSGYLLKGRELLNIFIEPTLLNIVLSVWLIEPPLKMLVRAVWGIVKSIYK